MTPREISRMNYEDMACLIEAEHCSKTGCLGRVEAIDAIKVGDRVVSVSDGRLLGEVTKIVKKALTIETR